MSVVSVLLVQSDRLVREGLRLLLRDSEIGQFYEAEDVPAALRHFRDGKRGDMILVDLSPDLDPSKALGDLREAAPAARIVILNGGSDGKLLTKCVEMGANGFLLKNISPEALIRALHLAMLGEPVFPIHSDLLRSNEIGPVLANGVQPALMVLSAKEMAIVRCLTGGLSNKIIARDLDLTEATVKAYLKSIMRKIHAANRTQAAIWAIANGLDRPGAVD